MVFSSTGLSRVGIYARGIAPHEEGRETLETS